MCWHEWIAREFLCEIGWQLGRGNRECRQRVVPGNLPVVRIKQDERRGDVPPRVLSCLLAQIAVKFICARRKIFPVMVRLEGFNSWV